MNAKEKDIMIYGLGLEEERALEVIPETKTPELTRKRTKQYKFLRAFVETGGIIQQALRDTKIPHNTYKNWVRYDQVFLEAMEKAKLDTIILLEGEVVRRGYQGYYEPVFFQGQEVGKIKKFSDQMLKLRLCRLDPSYKEGPVTNIGVQGADVKISFIDPKS